MASLRDPPTIGAIIAPNATNPLKIPEALSFKVWFSSSRFSAMITLSMISGSEAMKKNKQPILKKKYPIINIHRYL